MRQVMAFVLVLLFIFGLWGCVEPQPENPTDPSEQPTVTQPTEPPETQPVRDGELIPDGTVLYAGITSMPEGYDYSFRVDAAQAVADYLTGLNLIADFKEDPNEYAGMTWVIFLAYDNGETETVYLFGNMFIRSESGPWYRLSYEEASGFDALLSELYEPIAAAPIPKSSEELENFLAQYSDPVYESLYTLDGLPYGRIISSSETPEEAVAVCTRRFTDNRYLAASNTVVECEVIYESELFYGVHVEWDYYNDGEFVYRYEENVISFKKSIADITVRDVKYDEVDSYRLLTHREDLLTELALYLFYHENSLTQLIDYEVLQEGSVWQFTVYAYRVSYGDWDMDNEYTFTSQEIHIDLTDGSVTFREPKTLLILYQETGNSNSCLSG